MKYLKYFGLLVMIGLFVACSDDDETLIPSDQDLFPAKTNSEIDLKLRELFSPYNTIVEYRYIKNFLDDEWYSITPAKEELVVPMGNFLIDFWVNPLKVGSSADFVAANFPKKIILVGSAAYQLNGSRVLGQAEAGTLIRYTEVNDFDLSNSVWLTTQLNTAFHEYAHILHQTFKMPDQYRKVTPDSYTKNGWRAVSQSNAIERGMVSPYATNSVADDFAELFSRYITHNDTMLEALLYDELINTDSDKGTVTDPEEFLGIVKRNEGRAFIRTKLGIMKKFLSSVGFDLEKVREAAQAKINE
ncbi:substrate import-associated zinc metallohydrolase lipoprotein [Labilibaculum antarcticum]|uniref:Substrate import-associated zinc metallohydrolase lipoprotein n=1 Tax=Labilibaculum antarcticum TaxID=1717717 RepID=A0A1Y1CFT4_9BACT|nr:substrate import-associated zinc metallohydrolase lipoprotein [Labilibaculum antarcticum]BAX79150.1 hypothetical protein ALGA_0761 [Labilibaculum antarcticum]